MIEYFKKKVGGNLDFDYEEMTEKVTTESVRVLSSLPFLQTRSLLEVTTQYTIFAVTNETVTTGPNKSNCDPNNPWCGQFGLQQYFEIVYLTVLTVLGIFGNLLVIFSIIVEKKTHKNGNLFISSLAVADFVVSKSLASCINSTYNFLYCKIFRFAEHNFACCVVQGSPTFYEPWATCS